MHLSRHDITCRTIVALWEAMGKAIALGSPTGRAAQRLSEMTGQEAKTIHRLLEFDPKHIKCKRDSENPIGCASKKCGVSCKIIP